MSKKLKLKIKNYIIQKLQTNKIDDSSKRPPLIASTWPFVRLCCTRPGLAVGRRFSYEPAARKRYGNCEIAKVNRNGFRFSRIVLVSLSLSLSSRARNSILIAPAKIARLCQRPASPKPFRSLPDSNRSRFVDDVRASRLLASLFQIPAFCANPNS